MELRGKRIIITGASKGIGKACALMLAAKGCRLVLTARTQPLLEEVAAEVRRLGGEALALTLDMSAEADIREMISATVREYGGIDVLINNAGVGIFKSIAETSTEDWDTMFNLNMRGLFIATREALPHLRRAGESFVVNVASLAGKNPIPGGAAYAATKHAVMGFTKSLMLEERKNGLRTLAICPGSVDTPFFDGHRDMLNDDKRKRILQAGDVASAIVHALELPQNAMISEIDIRPSNP